MIQFSFLTIQFSIVAARTLLPPDTYITIGWWIVGILTVVGLLVLWRSRRRWLKWGVAVAVPLLWMAFVYGAYFGIYRLEVRHVELAFDDLPPAFDGYRIVQFSDVHVGTLTGSRRQILERAIDSINAQQADAVVFTGDLQNIHPNELEPFIDLLKTVKGKDGVFAVKGNHDYPMYVEDLRQKDDDSYYRMLLDEEICWNNLDNSRFIVERGDERIVIAGMENDGDGERFPQKGNVQRALSGISHEDFVVMLEHDPTSWRRKILRECHAQLTLSGHTHGGQVSLFGLSPASLVYSESEGLYCIAGRYLYVTKGLSGVVPFRLGATPEIVVITLRKK